MYLNAIHNIQLLHTIFLCCSGKVYIRIYQHMKILCTHIHVYKRQQNIHVYT